MSGTKNDIRDRKQYQGDISFLCPPVINLIKAQVCDKQYYHLPLSNHHPLPPSYDVDQHLCRGVCND